MRLLSPEHLLYLIAAEEQAQAQAQSQGQNLDEKQRNLDGKQLFLTVASSTRPHTLAFFFHCFLLQFFFVNHHSDNPILFH
ncbi:hypothetical protein L2E82_04039 [Cichorium intybus]|uniref:Uncharacterized protein n=1 Tax=Cichorium intybus TaxID=13427 RepID=A0ACB9H604_CICIN|nr:hypothetical protein L2E82_04039 [Cichorium intybus]